MVFTSPMGKEETRKEGSIYEREGGMITGKREAILTRGLENDASNIKRAKDKDGTFLKRTHVHPNSYFTKSHHTNTAHNRKLDKRDSGVNIR